MSVSRISYVFAAFVVGVSALACAPEKPSSLEANQRRVEVAGQDEQSQEAVAVVNGETITIGEFERRLASLAPFARARYGTVERKQEYLNSVVQFEVMADEAERLGLGKDPAVLHSMKEAMVRVMLQEVLRQRVPLRDISDEAVDAFYQEHRADYVQPERRRAVVILVDTRDGAERLKRSFEAEPAEEESERINAFRRLANQHSTHRVSAENGGDIGFFEAGKDEDDAYRIETARALFALEGVATVSEPHETERGWQLVMAMEHTPERVRPLEDVARDIRTKLFEDRRQQARAEYIEELMQAAEVELFTERLEGVELPEVAVPRRLEELHLIPVRDLKGSGVVHTP